MATREPKQTSGWNVVIAFILSVVIGSILMVIMLDPSWMTS